MACGRGTRRNYEVPTNPNSTIALRVSEMAPELEKIIWDHGGSICKFEDKWENSPKSYIVQFPEHTLPCDMYEDGCMDELTPRHYPNKWIYRVPAKEKYIWLLATVISQGIPPILSRTMNPWKEEVSFSP